ncbi:MAG TPA: ABC transporter permease [Saprospiraceae bacterium]|nr:ABC transporter permease [Saprospiraceae bacterium]
MNSTFKKFISSPLRAFALFFISLCSLLSIFVFLVVQDKTPQINEQIPAISLKEPGFQIILLSVHKESNYPPVPLWRRIFSGSPSTHDLIPVSSWHISGDSIYYKQYEEEVSRDSIPVQSLNLAQIIYGREAVSVLSRQGDSIALQVENGMKENFSISQLSKEVRKNHIERRTFWFGTDIFGRSLFARTLLGLRFSLLIGLLAVLLSITIGTMIGMVAGYFGGRIDSVLNYIMNVFWSIPTLILVFAIVLVTGRGIQNIFIAVGLTMWVDAARLVRGQVLALRSEKYIESVKVMGMGAARIIFRHILPNMMGPLIVIAVSNFASAIIIESGLSYLGFGIQPPAPSLGSLLSENYSYILSGKPMLAIIPVVVLLLLVFSFNLVGNGIRDIFDVKSDIRT